MTDTTDELTALRQEIAELRAEQVLLRAALQARPIAADSGQAVASVQPSVGSRLADTQPAPNADGAPERASRRGMLKLAAGAAAGGVGLAVAASSRVAAVDGSPVNAGAVTVAGDTGPNRTVLNYTNAAGPSAPFFLGTLPANLFLATDEGGVQFSAYPAATAGYAYKVVNNGVYGFSGRPTGYGVVGSGGTGATGMLARGLRANLELFAEGATPASRTDAHLRGEIINDSTGAVWLCIAGGTPGTWRKLAGPGTAGAFHPIAPKRVYDSRAGEAPLAVVKGRLNPGENRVVDCTVNTSGVPATATAVAFNLTAANTVGRGNLSAYPDGSPVPTTSSVNYTAGVNIANATVSGCGPGAKIRVVCGGSTGADFIVDVVGYYL